MRLLALSLGILVLGAGWWLRSDRGTGTSPPDRQQQPTEVADRQVTVAEGLSVRQLVASLTSGDAAVDGFTAEDLEAALADPAMRSDILPADQPKIEGTLFPETYNITESATEAELVQKTGVVVTTKCASLRTSGLVSDCVSERPCLSAFRFSVPSPSFSVTTTRCSRSPDRFLKPKSSRSCLPEDPLNPP